MRNIFKNNCLRNAYVALLLLFLFGCARAGDYAGVNHGYMTVGIKQRFGEGADNRKYYVTKEGIELLPGAGKDTIRQHIGAPDKIQRNNEGYEVWTYNERKLKLYFDKERFREWANL
ncbi:MAG: hypothetical protein WCI77_10695 [Candidatus Omnitrophota bacterium]